MMRKINKDKVWKAYEASAMYVIRSVAKGLKDTFIIGDQAKKKYWDIGFNILWCEKQNCKKYQEILNLDFIRELRPELKELYQAI
jgi:hypothetical protein